MSNKIIKSKERVLQHGEVFTPQHIVEDMLNQDQIKPLTEELSATFLEPSAGEGVFLVEILKRKLAVAHDLAGNISQFEENALIALTSLYGIELLEDNVEMLVMNLSSAFDWSYYEEAQRFEAAINDDVIKSARTIISANMVQGNALTKTQSTGDPITFSEWELLPVKYGVQKVQRTVYTLDEILSDGEPLTATRHGEVQLDLFGFDDKPEDEQLELNLKEPNENLINYEPVKLIDVWQRKLVEAGSED